MKTRRSVGILLIIAILLCALSCSTAGAEGVATTVEEKVAQIVAECRAMGFSREYDIALWLHDWLIYHADYDFSLTYTEPDGVLLMGTGVCDSYSKAYCLLLDAFGIANMRVTSEEMNHAWNMAKLDGIWCHIDCTWDDPGEGGEENRVYFGMNDALMRRDHDWSAAGYPATASLDNYYPLREGMPCFATDAELDAILSTQAGNQANPIVAVYVGEDASLDAMEKVQMWVGNNRWRYGLCEIGITGGCICILEAEYTEPWEQPPENHLNPPVDAPSFDLNSPRGRYMLSNYGDNGVVLVFGRTTCGNTRALLSRLSGQLSELYEGGVDVIVSLDDAAAPADLAGIEADLPGFHYTYGSDVLWDYMGAVGFQGEISVAYPCVFVVTRSGKIIYYSTDIVFDVDGLLAEIRTAITNNPLPEPVVHNDLTPMLNGSGNVNDIANAGSIASAVQSGSRDGNVILLIDYAMYGADAKQLEYYEAHYGVFRRLGVQMVACFVNVEDDEKSAYPHCTFVDYDNNDFWALQYAMGYSGGSISYRTSMLIGRGGDIAAYASGSLLDMNNCMLYAARQLRYDAVAPAALTAIDGEAFRGTAFKRIDLTNGCLAEIGSEAFKGCRALEFVRIPETVTEIGSGAFDDCGDVVVICTVGSAGFYCAVDSGLEYICE